MEWSSIKSVLKDSLSKSKDSENNANEIKREDIAALIALTLYQNYTQFESNMGAFLSNKAVWVKNYYLDINTPVSQEIKSLLFSYLQELEKSKIKINLNNFFKAIEKDYLKPQTDLHLIAEFIIKNKSHGKLNINPDSERPSVMELAKILDDLKFMRKDTTKVFFSQIEEVCRVHAIQPERNELDSVGIIKTASPALPIDIDLEVFHTFFDLSNHPDKLFLTENFWKKLKQDYLTVKKFRNNEGKVGSCMPEYSKIICAYFVLALRYENFEELKEKFLAFFSLTNEFLNQSQVINTTAALFSSWKESERYRLEKNDLQNRTDFLEIKDEILSTFPDDFFANLESHYLEEFFGYIDTSIYADEISKIAYTKHLQNIILKISPLTIFQLGLIHSSPEAQESESTKAQSQSILYATGMAIGVSESMDALRVRQQIQDALQDIEAAKAFKEGLLVSWLEENKLDYLEKLVS